jgi:hypothetical protein
MKAKCISEKLTSEQITALGKNYFSNQDYHITIGKEYLVLGLIFSSGKIGNGCFVEHLTDYGHYVLSPICLFDVIDKRISKYWKFEIDNDGDYRLWLPPTVKTYYHNDTSEEDELDVVADFLRMKKLLEEEEWH